jgi:hypothetical protein
VEETVSFIRRSTPHLAQLSVGAGDVPVQQALVPPSSTWQAAPHVPHQGGQALQALLEGAGGHEGVQGGLAQPGAYLGGGGVCKVKPRAGGVGGSWVCVGGGGEKEETD